MTQNRSLTGLAAPRTRGPAVPDAPPRAALYLLASLIGSLLAASAAPTPLYAIYQRQWGFTPITVTIVFGIYAVAVLVALLTLGRLSDSIGRKPVLLAALAVQVVSMLVYATAGGVGELLAARVIQGLSTGAALGAIGAAMLDVDRARGALANALAPGLGTGTGALVSALFVGTLVSGIGFGAGFQGGIRSVIPLAEPHERAGVLSLLFVVSYLGMGIPAVAAGFGATDGLGLLGAARVYGVALIAAAGLALAGLYRTRRAGLER